MEVGTQGHPMWLWNPQKVAIDIYGKDYVTDTTFDPTRLSKNTINGIVPANTTLSIVYRIDNTGNSNIAAGRLTRVSSAKLKFANRNALVTSKNK